MALTYNQLDAITDAFYMRDIQQTWADQNLVTKRLHKGGTKSQGGERIKQPVFYNFSKGDWFGEYDQFDISSEERITAAYWDWKQMEVPLVMSRLEQLKNNNPRAIHSLMEQITKGAKIRAGQLMSQAVFSANGDSATAIGGLQNMLSPAGRTLGGIASTSTTYSWWQPVSKPGAATAIWSLGGTGYCTYENLNIITGAAHDGNISVDLVCLGPRAYHYYLQDAHAVQRLIHKSAAEQGFMTAEVNGIEIVADRHITESNTEASNYGYCLNTDFIDLVSHTDENFRREPWSKPIDQNVIVSHLYWAGNLTTSDPSRSVMFTNFIVDADGA